MRSQPTPSPSRTSRHSNAPRYSGEAPYCENTGSEPNPGQREDKTNELPSKIFSSKKRVEFIGPHGGTHTKGFGGVLADLGVQFLLREHVLARGSFQVRPRMMQRIQDQRSRDDCKLASVIIATDHVFVERHRRDKLGQASHHIRAVGPPALEFRCERQAPGSRQCRMGVIEDGQVTRRPEERSLRHRTAIVAEFLRRVRREKMTLRLPEFLVCALRSGWPRRLLVSLGSRQGSRVVKALATRSGLDVSLRNAYLAARASSLTSPAPRRGVITPDLGKATWFAEGWSAISAQHAGRLGSPLT
ncbi:hypothetical protein VTN96DRAFT_6917 [Rasamsonia emersonii]